MRSVIMLGLGLKMRSVIMLLCIVNAVASLNCYTIVSIIQEKNIYMYPETERRLHRLCPSVTTHLVNGNIDYDGVVDTLLNRIDGSPMYNCVEYSEEDKYLNKIGLSCDKIRAWDN